MPISAQNTNITPNIASPPGSVSSFALTGVPTGIDNFGDSITFGVGAVSVTNTGGLANSFATQLDADVAKNSAAVNNYGVGGNECADMAKAVYANLTPNSSSNPAVTMETGVNDGYLRSSPTSTGNQTLFSACYQSAMAWATVPRQFKVYAQDSQCSTTGTWTNATAWVSGVGKTSSASGATLTCTVIVGPSGVLYVGYYWNDSSTGTMTWTIDSVSQTTLAAEPVTISTQNGVTDDIPLARVTGLSQGSHTVVFTTTSTQQVAVYWLGSAWPIRTPAPPTVYAMGVPYTYNGGPSGCTSCLVPNSTTSVFDNLTKLATSTLASDGLQIIFVDIRNGGPANPNTDTGRGWINSTTDMAPTTTGAGGLSCTNYATGTTQGLHPSARTIGSTVDGCGHDHLRQAFEYYMQPRTGYTPGQIVCEFITQTAVTPNGTVTDLFSSITKGISPSGGGCELPAGLLSLNPNFHVSTTFSHNSGSSTMDYQWSITPVTSSTWAATTAYSVTQILLPTSNNTSLDYFEATVAGTSGSTQPTWSTTCGTAGNTCTDGGVTWTNLGSGICIASPGWASSNSGAFWQYADIMVTSPNNEDCSVDIALSGSALAPITGSGAQGTTLTMPTTIPLNMHLTCVGGTTDQCRGFKEIVRAEW